MNAEMKAAMKAEKPYMRGIIAKTEEEAEGNRECGYESVTIADFNERYGLSSTMEGTEKQVAWAMDIRTSAMRYLFKNTLYTDTATRAKIAQKANAKNASYWIDNRDNFALGIKKDMEA